ncbi:predicted protein [Naegleria gruberi]|uniref:Predicted protein n=1 Tax=Naegleria gruberi TaxID=5762 RepID=D2VPE7_NAEGR|nr:uncharacterized protein NAEGRDRAFT_70832 [Naegleria gruberi]EFC41347.1 predicted protein [Naegleria gruberi]|eukprot:XP_002674091.1 predicted protein [Naegleria gruberi strain NEG-M]
MAKHPPLKIKTQHRNPEEVKALFSENIKYIESFLDKFNISPQESDSIVDNLFEKNLSLPLFVSIYDDTNSKMKFSNILTFLKYLLTVGSSAKVTGEDITELIVKVSPCIEFIQYGLDNDIGNSFDKLLSGNERIDFSSDKIVEEWLVSTYHIYFCMIKQFIATGKLSLKIIQYFRKALLHLLVILRHIGNRKRMAIMNGDTDFNLSFSEKSFMVLCSNLLKKGFKHGFLQSNYAHQRVFLEGIYYCFDNRMNYAKFLHTLLVSTEKRGFRTMRSLIRNDIQDIGELTGNDIIPHGISKGDTATNVATRAVKFLCSLYGKMKDINMTLLPVLLEFLPFVLKVLNWTFIPAFLKEVATQVCAVLVGTFEHAATPTVENEHYLNIIRDALPFLFNYVSTKIQDLSSGTQVLCYNMIIWIAKTRTSFTIEQLTPLLEIYEPKLISKKEYLEMIKSVWVRTVGREHVLNPFFMKRLSEMSEIEILHEEALPRVKMIMHLLNIFSQSINNYIDLKVVAALTIKKIEEFLNKTESTTLQDFDMSNTFCKILIHCIDNITDVENIFPILHDLIKVAISTEHIHRTISSSDISDLNDFIFRLFKYEEGYFLDLVRLLHDRGLLEKCCKGEESGELINNLILPYVLEQSKGGESRVPSQATWVLISLVVSDMVSSRKLVERIKHHIIESCSFLRDGPTKFDFLQRPYYKALLSLATLIFAYYPEEMIDYLLPNSQVLFSSALTSPDTSNYFPLLYNFTLSAAEYFLDNDLLSKSPEMLLSLQVLFTFVHYMPLNVSNIILVRRVVNKFDLSVREFSS